jgi:hypothetical protein
MVAVIATATVITYINTYLDDEGEGNERKSHLLQKYLRWWSRKAFCILHGQRERHLLADGLCWTVDIVVKGAIDIVDKGEDGVQEYGSCFLPKKVLLFS